ncbi:MAG: IdeS/Mac family cysteine endopeptidase, partial [Akkermansia sp.]|nr:IdeS/Mac family cysteine endopeptidase [Akkermansia sp.]
MKLRLNHLLRTAVLTAMAAVSPYTYAGTTYLAEGIDMDNILNSERFYDTGKGYYFEWVIYGANYLPGFQQLYKEKGNLQFLGDLYGRINHNGNTLAKKVEPLTGDSNTCWAQVSMNLVEYWHSYYGVFCKDSRKLTYGLCYDKQYLDETGGTLSLKQNLVFLDTFSNDGDSLSSYLNWFMLGDDDPYFSTIEIPNQGGYWTDYFTTSSSTHNWYSYYWQDELYLSKLAENLLTTLGYVKNTNVTYKQHIKGQLVYLGLTSTEGTGGHAITCHGVELNDKGQLKALYVTNSDDLEYKLFKVYLDQNSTKYLLYADEQCTELWEYANSNWYIDSVGGIRTPQVLQNMLAEYEDENNALVWTGNTTANGLWDLKSAPTTLELPDETSGWEIYAVDGYYAAYFDKDRIICFDDYADSGAVNVKNSGSAYRMELSNDTLAYTFTGEGNNMLTVDTLVADGGGKASFHKMQLNTTAATISKHTISMGSGATWSGNATVSANGTVDLAGGTLALTELTLNGGMLSITGRGTLQSGSIVSSNGATLLFTPTGTTTTPMLTIGSGVSFSGSALDIAMGGEGLVFDTTYALISFENAQTDWQKWFTTQVGEFSYQDNILYIIYSPVPKLTWSGTTGTWSSGRWGSTTTGTNDLRAEFTGSGTITVTIENWVRPYSVTVNNSGDITFNGSTGSIVGEGVLKKSGTGSLTIYTANKYIGGTQISGGTLTVWHATALGSGDVALSGGTLNLSSRSVSNTLNVSGNATINGGSAYNGVLVLA